MEALDLADNERSALHEYEQMIARMPENDTVKLQPPTRNPLLVAYNLEPEAYVLQVVEKIASTSLHDALLVLPFGKVISLMSYLNIWAQKVVTFDFVVFRWLILLSVGLEHYPGIPNHILPASHTSPPNCCEPDHENLTTPSPHPSSKCPQAPEGCPQLQSSCSSIPASQK